MSHKVISISIKFDLFKKIRGVLPVLGFDSFNKYANYALELISEWDKTFTGCLEFYQDRIGVKSEYFLRMIVVNFIAMMTSQMAVYGRTTENFFYTNKDGQLLNNKELYSLFYNRHEAFFLKAKAEMDGQPVEEAMKKLMPEVFVNQSITAKIPVIDNSKS